MAKLGRKGSLKHDRKHLLYSYRRALKKGWAKKVLSENDFIIKESLKARQNALTDEEVSSLLKVAKNMHYFLFVQCLIAVTMGMRKGEIVGLRMDEIDLINNEINPDADRIKTRIERKIPIPIASDVLPHLKRLMSECRDHNGTYLFPFTVKSKRDYSRPAETIPRKSWNKLRKETEIECQFKDFRTTCATNMIASGIPFPAVAKVLGHSIHVLNDIYDKMNLEVRSLVANVFNDRFIA